MKNIFFLVVGVVLLSSCSAYQDALKNNDVKAKYDFADSLYSQGKYKKALRLWEQIVPLYRGRPQAERVTYLYADTYYQLGDYYNGGYQFERFVKSFPQSTKREEAAFKGAQSYFNRSPRFNLDQGDTFIALEKLQTFINEYPDSEQVSEANEKVQELNTKLERKAYEIAKGYNKIGASRGTFINAISAFDSFLIDYPGSVYREDALYWKFNSAYQLAIGSINSLKTERLQAARVAYKALEKYYPEGKYTKEVTKEIAEINEALQSTDLLN